MTKAKELDSIRRELVQYLQRHPQASDTLEGIDSYWLRPGLDDRTELVQEALDALVARGLIEKVNAADGSLRYRAVRG